MDTVLVNKDKLIKLCNDAHVHTCSSIAEVKNCTDCVNVNGGSCGQYLFNYLTNNQEKENDIKELTEWKFILPCDIDFYRACSEKAKKLSFNNLIGDYTFFYFSKNTGIKPISKEKFEFILCKELNTKEFLSLPEPQQKKELTEWKFAIPSDIEAFQKCTKKLLEYKFDLYGKESFYCYKNGLLHGFSDYNYYCNLDLPELSLTELLALPKPQQKKKLPEWVNKNNPMMFGAKHGAWLSILFLKEIEIYNAIPFISTSNVLWDKIAPIDKEYLYTSKRHPHQITSDDLKDYDLSDWIKEIKS